jgi:hypothetical protein
MEKIQEHAEYAETHMDLLESITLIYVEDVSEKERI